MVPELLQIREETGSTMSQQFFFLYKKVKILLQKKIGLVLKQIV
jgi:hypothetical protein